MAILTRASFHCRSSESQPLEASASTDTVSPDELTFHCPLKTFHNYRDCVNGRRYAKVSFLKHLQDRHLSSAAKVDFCRELIATDLNIYLVWEKLLCSLRMWLCCRCMHLHAWSMPCRGRQGVVHGEVIVGPLNGDGEDFLLHSLVKPGSSASLTLSNVVSCVDSTNGVESLLLSVDTGVLLSTDLLNVIFQRQFTTVKCIPHQCRLSFSREVKHCLDRVIASPGNIFMWIQILLLPFCTLTLFRP